MVTTCYTQLNSRSDSIVALRFRPLNLVDLPFEICLPLGRVARLKPQPVNEGLCQLRGCS